MAGPSDDDRDLRWTVLERAPLADLGIGQAVRSRARHPTADTVVDFTVLELGDWVNVIALTPDDHVVLLRQYRAGTDRVELEIPGGLVDPGEAHEAAARRELLEETGFAAPRWRHLGSTWPNPAIQGNRLHSWLALDAVPSAPPSPDEGEALAITTAPLVEVAAMLRDGRIDHALVVVAFTHLALHGDEGLVRPRG